MTGAMLEWLESVDDIKNFKEKISQGGWLRPACISHLTHGFNVTQGEAEDVIDLFVRGCEVGALTRDNNGVGNDYVLKEGADSVWIRVDDIAAYVQRTDDGVSVDLCPAGFPGSETMTLDSALAYSSDAEEMANAAENSCDECDPDEEEE